MINSKRKDFIEYQMKGFAMATWYFIAMQTKQDKERFVRKVGKWVRGEISGEPPTFNFERLRNRSTKADSRKGDLAVREHMERFVIAEAARIQTQTLPFDFNNPLPELIMNSTFYPLKRKKVDESA